MTYFVEKCPRLPNGDFACILEDAHVGYDAQGHPYSIIITDQYGKKV